MALCITQSNRLETLADALAQRLGASTAGPLERATVIVQERGIARWLSLALADRLGIAANIAFPFPAHMLWSLFGRVLHDVAPESPFAPEVLRWRFMALLAREHGAARHPRLAHYLSSGDVQRRYELACQLAQLFDRYLVYRPQWIAAWSAGESRGLGSDEIWQAALWRELAADLPIDVREHPAQHFYAALEHDQATRAQLPRVLHLFAIQALPNAYLDMFSRLSAFSEIQLYTLNPCREYWSQIVRPREVLRQTLARPEQQHYLEVGNSLLASMGRHGRAFFDALTETPAQMVELFDENAGSTLLAQMQNDILNLREHGADAMPNLQWLEGDDSLQMHICHSAMREVEVLHDRLLDAFARDPNLRPSDVLVLIPRIEDYAPAIEAVFATAPEKQRMAFSIADLGAQKQSELLRGFLQLLHISESRLEAEQVFALLEQSGIARHFDLLPDDFVLLRQWVRESGIRWGRDENARIALDLPPTREHSWRYGFDRLLLGYALPGEGVRMFNGVLPYDDIEGGEAQLLGRLQVFVDALAALESALLQPRSLAQWKSLLERVLTQFYTLDENEQRDAQALRAAAASLLSNATRAAFDTAVPLEVWRDELEALLESAPRTNAFLNGGISFAALRPMRPVPARFVALLGLNDGEFPRPQSNASFDLLAQHPLPGDRAARDEDRYALLEAMLAAREHLYLSYTGRSVRDNTALPPSPLLSEVLDALKRGVGAAAEELLPRLLIEHPLQAFSQRYFDGSDARLYSYVEDYAAASRAALAQRNAAAPFFGTAPGITAEPGVTAEPDNISLDSLQRFWRNPSQCFVREHLGLRLEVEEELLQEAEPFAPDALALSQLRREMLAQLITGASADQSRALARAAGRLPHGASGDVLHARLIEQLRPLQQAVLGAGPLTRQSFEIECDGELISGSLDGLGATENLQWQAGRLHARARLKSWLTHLFGCAAGIQKPTRILGLDKTLVLQPVADAAAQLQSLCALMRAGQTAPLPFFPDSSFAYAQAVFKNGKVDPLSAAHNAWDSVDRARGESEDAYFALAFRGAKDPLDQAFEKLALAVYMPLLGACRDE